MSAHEHVHICVCKQPRLCCEYKWTLRTCAESCLHTHTHEDVLFVCEQVHHFVQYVCMYACAPCHMDNSMYLAIMWWHVDTHNTYSLTQCLSTLLPKLQVESIPQTCQTHTHTCTHRGGWDPLTAVKDRIYPTDIPMSTHTYIHTQRWLRSSPCGQRSNLSRGALPTHRDSHLKQDLPSPAHLADLCLPGRELLVHPGCISCTLCLDYCSTSVDAYQSY